MQSVPREWLDFLRQQFPKDSRIQLTEIGGNPRPISPGSTGKLDYIDDAGQFHVKWDNGCTLALVLGEDRFSVYLPEPQTFKLYMPLTADFYGRDEWGDMSEDGEEWDGHTLMDYEGQILSALVKNRVPEENESGLMRWYALWNSCGCNSISKGCDTGWNGMGTSNTRHTAVAGLDPSGRNRSCPSSQSRKGESCDGGKRPADKRQRPPNPG